MENKGLIGVQMMMLKEKVETLGAYETLKKLSEIGFHCVEISQIPMTPENIAGMKKACDDFGITIAACSTALEPMMPGMPGEYLVSDFDKIVADCKTLNCNFLRIGMLPMTCMGNKDKVLDFVTRADAMAEKLAVHGIELYYHNHHIEFQKFDGEYLLDIIKNNTKYMGFELDVHWIQRGGENPVAFIKSYKNRVTLLHLKDYRIGQIVMPEGQLGREAFTQAFASTVQFAEVGEGNLPMKEIIETGLACGSKYFLIEQDDQYGRDPFDCLATSMENLKKLGFATWF